VGELNKYTVTDELHFEEQAGAPEEWTNIPNLIARFLIINQKHLGAIIGYNNRRSGEETSKSVRTHFEGEVAVSIFTLICVFWSDLITVT